ncbi:MAG: amino acid permease [Candidatus Freyarchaeota archaeon]
MFEKRDKPLEKPTLFLRKASGLVREWSAIDMWYYNIISQPFYVGAYLLAAAAAAHPEGSVSLSWIITGIFVVFSTLTISMLASTMPRTGGHYLWQSRALHGSIGFVNSFIGMVFAQFFWAASCTWFINETITSPLMFYLGYYLDNPSLMAVGEWISTTEAIFLMSVVWLVWCFFINALGMKWYARMQHIFITPVGWIGLGTWIYILAANFGRTDIFISKLNSLASTVWEYPNAYQSIIDLAKTQVPVLNPPITWEGTWLLIPIAMGMLPVVAYGTELMGEMRGATSIKRQIFANVGACIYVTFIFSLFYELAVGVVGREFFNAHAILWFNDAVPIPIPAFFTQYITILTYDNAALTIWCIIAGLLWAIPMYPNLFLSSTRAVFAYSFDRIFPSKLGYVTKRFHVPIYSLIFMFGMSLLFTWLYSYTVVSTWVLSASLASMIMIGFTNLAGMVLPYRRPELWKASPASKYKIGNIPLITITGIPFFVISLVMAYYFLAYDEYGINTPVSLIFLACLYVVTAVVYFSYRYYRKKQGIDIDLLYKEIPSA